MVEITSRRDLTKAAIILIVSAAVTMAVIFLLGGEGMIRELKAVRTEYIILAIAIQVIYTALWAFRWGLIVRAQGQQIPRDILPLTFSGAFFNNITPVSKTGGEPVRGYLMGRATDTSFEEGLASVVVDRIFDMVPFIFICLGTFLLIWIFELPATSLLLTVVFIGLIASTALSIFFIYGALNRDAGLRLVLFFIDKLSPIISRFRTVAELKEQTRMAVVRFYDGVECISRNKRLMAVSLLISLALWVLVILRLKVIFISLAADQSLLVVNIVAVAMIFAGFVPFLPGGLVITESIMILLFTGLGVQRDIAGSAVLLDRFVSYWFMSFVGALASLYLGLKLDILRKASHD